MLTHLKLRDLVIVDEAELDFDAGLTALTGETGAGKSIVVDALLLLSGGRGAGDVVRQGAERAEISANFTALSADALRWLESQAVEHDGEVLVRRVIGADGRSRAYLNGQLVAIQALREFAEFLLEIHGQQEFLHLVKRSAQRELLDEHLGGGDLRGALAGVYARYRECRLEVDARSAAAENRDARLDLLRYQLTELEAEVTSEAAIEELFIEQKRIAGRGRLAGAARTALEAVYEAEDGANACELLGKAATSLRGLADTDPALAQPAQLLAEAGIAAREAAESLRHYLDALDMDPARQEQVERQAAALEALARKHRQSVLELPAHLERMREELHALTHAELKLAESQERLEALSRDYGIAAERLTAARQRAAASLGREISTLMNSLGMAGGRFAVSVTPSEERFGPNGRDEVEFLVSANPGQPLKSLAKVASGGELSRISLAVQVAAAANAGGLCMVFDEVDAGIGGAVAEIVGRQLRALGERCQVLCVTHLAQVASQAHSQFRVSKQSRAGLTRTAVETLSAEERIDEVARMLGGIDITPQAREHAREMLTRSAAAAPGSAPGGASGSAPPPAAGKKRAPGARPLARS
jgi:DNA repair protein RecN (Recombination protein N)